MRHSHGRLHAPSNTLGTSPVEDSSWRAPRRSAPSSSRSTTRTNPLNSSSRIVPVSRASASANVASIATRSVDCQGPCSITSTYFALEIRQRNVWRRGPFQRDVSGVQYRPPPAHPGVRIDRVRAGRDVEPAHRVDRGNRVENRDEFDERHRDAVHRNRHASYKRNVHERARIRRTGSCTRGEIPSLGRLDRPGVRAVADDRSAPEVRVGRNGRRRRTAGSSRRKWIASTSARAGRGHGHV